ncbi:hypothetical protein Tco_1354597 [Tanacetum coccineum]
MLDVTEPSTSPSRITSSPSPSPEPSPSHSPEPSTQHSPDHTTAAVSFPSPTQPTQPSPGAEQHIPTPHDSPLHAVHSHGSDEGSLKLNELTNLVTKLSDRVAVLEDDLRKTKKTYSSALTKLILRVKKLEARVKIGKSRKRAKVVLSEDDADVQDDSSKQGRKLSDAEVQEKASTETEPIIQEVTPTEVIQDQGSSEKGSAEISTAGATKGTASEVPVVSTAEENISTAGRTVTYRRRSEEQRTRKDKGKAIMTESEPKKKSKKELEQERLSFAEAIRLEEQMNEEQRAQIARDEEIARQWDKEERQRAMSEAKSTKKIDWNDPSVIRYHALKMKPKTIAQARRNMIKYLKNQGNYKISDFKGMSYNEIRPIFEKVWDFNQHIEPMEHGSEKMKSPEKIEEKDADTQKEVKEVAKESGAKRKKSLPRKRRIVKRQKLEEDAEKEELKGFLDIIPREEFAEDVESLSTKYPIVDWKTYTLTENFMYYQIFRGDGSSKNYKVLSEMLEDFDRQDVEELYRLVKERYSASRPEGYDLMLWGDLHTLFEPDEDDEIWKNQHEYNVISWSLYDFCGIHILLMQNGIAIHMLTEKKYPLSQEMISKMLKKKLEVDHESSQAFELLRIDQGVGSTSGIRACSLRNFDLEVMELENTQNNAEMALMALSDSKGPKVKIRKRFEFKIAKFEKSAKNLDQLLASQITDKSKKGFGYNVVPSPHHLILNRPTPFDLSYSGLEEFKEPESDNSKENTDDSLKQQQKTDSKTSYVKSPLKKKFVKPEKPVRRSVRAHSQLNDEGFYCGYSLSRQSIFMGKQGVSESSTSSQQDQDCIVMPILKDASYFGDDAPRSVADAQIQDKDRLQDENDATEKSHEYSSLKDNGTADQQVNTASPEVYTGSRDVSTATPEDLVGPSHESEVTQVEDQEIELGNIPQSYAVPTTPHTRIHKDHPIDHVIGDVQSFVQTRRMTSSYSELGFLSAIYEGRTHKDLHTCLRPGPTEKKGSFNAVKINMSMRFEKVTTTQSVKSASTPQIWTSLWFKMEMAVDDIFIDL